MALKAAIDEGASEPELWTDHFLVMMRHSRAAMEYKASTMQQRMLTAPPRCEVIWGPPGSGKSTLAYERAVAVCNENGWNPDFEIFFVSKGDEQTTWWDGYASHRIIIFNDFYGWVGRAFLQRLVDIWPGRVGTKGGSRQFMGEYFYFTSNQHPSKWWPKIGLGAMERRLTVVQYLDYSEVAPCAECSEHPHAVDCAFTPDSLAPATASRGPRSVTGYVAADGTFIPL